MAASKPTRSIYTVNIISYITGSLHLCMRYICPWIGILFIPIMTRTWWIYSARKSSTLCQRFMHILNLYNSFKSCVITLLRGSACQKSTGIWCDQTWCVLRLHCITHFWSKLQSNLYTPEGWHTSATDWDIYQWRPSHQVWSCTRCELQNTGGCSGGWCEEYSRHQRLHHWARW